MNEKTNTAVEGEKKIEMVEVVALEPGHDGRVYRQANEKFSVTSDRLEDGTTWFVRAEDAPAPKAKTKPDRPPGAGPAKGSAAEQ